ncbi:hypothetical protein CsatA_006311 [Cannabis sativa]|uniref:S-protein homolog n=1 Tax=Cannabis sativa TaxID=3483 RepID=A0A803PXW9_CANSA
MIQNCGCFVEARVKVQVVNRMDDKSSIIDLHCQSKDDDLGSVVLKVGNETEWSFSVNFLGTTLFYCDVKWSNSSSRYSFDAYDAVRDYTRCRTQCRWIISGQGSLYGYDQHHDIWVQFPLWKI